MISELRLTGGETILDIGCGDGVLTAQLSDVVPDGNVIGIDASVGMIHTAQKINRKNLTFIHMDANDIDFQDRFDILFSNAALHWVKDHPALLKNSYAALKANGIIKWSFGGEGNCSHFYNTVKTVMRAEAYRKYFINFEWPWFMPSKTEYEELAINARFECVEIILENADRYFTTADEMIRWIDQPSIVPFLTHIPDAEKQNFRQSVIDIMTETTRQPDGRYFETFRRINIQAKKCVIPFSIKISSGFAANAREALLVRGSPSEY